MRKFDENGLRLAKSQANMFVESISRYNCGSNYFIRRFMNSDICFWIDRFDEFDISSVFNALEKDYQFETGKEKFSVDSIYWIGYLYRYWAYTYEIYSVEIYKIITAKELNNIYEAYHSLDPDLAIKRIYEAKKIKPEKNMLAIMKKVYNK